MPKRKDLFRLFGVALLYFIVSSAVLQSFLTQWGTKIGTEFDATLAFARPRPYVYRVLVPLLVRGLTGLVPGRVGAALLRVQDPSGRGVVALAMARYNWPGEPSVAFLVAVGLLLGFLFGTAWVWRDLVRWALPERRFAADVVPALALLAFTLSFVRGGYLYDFSDLFFVSVGFLAFVRNRFWLFCLFLPLTILDKEASVLLLVWLLAAWGEWPKKQWFLRAGLSGVLGGSVLLAVWWTFHGGAGHMMEMHLGQNLRYWASFRWLFDIQDSFATGVPLPAAFNVVNVVLLTGILAYGWRGTPRIVVRAFVLSVLAVMPLFLVFGYEDEVRVFTIAVPPLLVIGLFAIDALYPGAPGAPGAVGAAQPTPSHPTA